jgi:hypothetical protein
MGQIWELVEALTDNDIRMEPRVPSPGPGG